MSEVLEQVKSAAYASLGVNLLVTDAIVGREVPTPEFAEEHAALARKHATKALTDFRAFSEPHAARLSEQLPDRVAEVFTDSRNKAWDFIGIKAPEADPATAADPSAADPSAADPSAAEGSDPDAGTGTPTTTAEESTESDSSQAEA